jgi:hypothetical protein
MHGSQVSRVWLFIQQLVGHEWMAALPILEQEPTHEFKAKKIQERSPL